MGYHNYTCSTCKAKYVFRGSDPKVNHVELTATHQNGHTFIAYIMFEPENLEIWDQNTGSRVLRFNYLPKITSLNFQDKLPYLLTFS